MRKLSLTLTLLTTLSMVGCRFPGGLPALNQPGPLTATSVRQPAPPLSGHVSFARRTTTAMADVATAATVSLINTGTNQTVSTALANANGDFVLNFSNGYVADPTATYFLEAVKGLNSNQPGSPAVRVRTVAKYTNGWTSITSATPNSGTMVGPETTALSIGAGLVNGTPGFTFPSLIGSVTGSSTLTYTPVTGLSSYDYTALLDLVQQILADAQDPIANVGMTLSNGQPVWSRLNVAPSITRFDPQVAKIGQSLSVTGTGFSPTAANNTLKFNGVTAVAANATSTGLTTSVPAGATSGPTSITVGNLTVLGPNFSVLPVIDSFDPKQGEAGTIVTLVGSGFDGLTRTNNLVEIGGVPAALLDATATELKVKVPAGATKGPITVTVNGQAVTTTSPYSAVYGIQTVAGTWAPKSSAATNWWASYTSMALDASGNVYTADTNGAQVYKISKDGTLSALAGTGKYGYSGNGGPANKAQLNNPNGVALDASGNVYIADTNNNVIRKVSAIDGTISTVAGSGTYGFSGDGGPAIQAKLAAPFGVAVDATGNLYIADMNNNRIREVSPDGTITTVADGLYWPQELAIDNSGTLYIAEPNLNRISKLNNGQTPTVVTSGPLNSPRGMTLDDSGTLYIADTNNQRIVKVVDDQISTMPLAGGSNPTGVVVDASGVLYVAVPNRNQIVKVVDGQESLWAGGTSAVVGGNALNVRLGSPSSVAADANGDLYIADSDTPAIWKLSQGALSLVSTGSTTLLNNPQAVAVDKGAVYVADTFNDQILKIVGGQVSTLYATSSLRPNALAVDSRDGSLYISSGYQNSVFKFSDGQVSTVNIGQDVRPRGLAVDATGNLYVSDVSGNRVLKVSAVDSTVSTVAGNGRYGYTGDGGLAIHAQFDGPNGLALDASGNIYVADRSNNVIRKISAADGTITTVVGTNVEGYSGDGGPAANARLDDPKSLVVGASGTLFIADSDNGVIRAAGF